jgi:hypothetical protein
MDTLIQFLAVFALSIMELWIAIPTGFVLGLNPVAIAIASTLGAIVGVLIAFLIIEKLLAWIVKRFGVDIVGFVQQRRMYRIWKKYGVVGLGLLAPLLTGAGLAIAIGLISGIKKRPLFFWISIGIMLWSAALTLAIFLGIVAAESLMDS